MATRARGGRHRDAGSFELACVVVQAVWGEFGPGVRDHVVSRFVMVRVRLLSDAESLL